MRGKQVFNEIRKDNKLRQDWRKGRNIKLIEKRNECLIARYYYYRNFTDKRYEVIIDLLVDEFWLTRLTLPQVISKYTVELRKLTDLRPERAYFMNKWPHMKW
ncbi:MAG TPA: hypothetical protein VN721_00945 [Flavipsychrobacter sp.]|nr:hypothetical protein [Flavipsychrobacter sp.]